MHEHSKTQFLIGLVALLWCEEVQARGSLLGVDCEQFGTVALELGKPRPTLGESVELALRRPPSVLEACELVPELAEGDEAFGGHVLEAAAGAVHLGDLLEPRLGLVFRVALVSPALLLDQLLERRVQTLGVAQEGEHELPHAAFEVLGPVDLRVLASTGVAVRLRAAVVVDDALAAGLELVLHGTGNHRPSALRAAGYGAREFPEAASSLRAGLVLSDGSAGSLDHFQRDARVRHRDGDPLAAVLEGVAAVPAVHPSRSVGGRLRHLRGLHPLAVVPPDAVEPVGSRDAATCGVTSSSIS